MFLERCKSEGCYNLVLRQGKVKFCGKECAGRSWVDRNRSHLRQYNNARWAVKHKYSSTLQHCVADGCFNFLLSRRPGERYCSKPCSYKGWLKGKGYVAKRWRKGNPLETLLCAQCGKEFTQTEGKQKYCTAECRGDRNSEANKDYHSGYAKKRWAKKKAANPGIRNKFLGDTKVCKTCGKTLPKNEFPTARLLCKDCLPAYRAEMHQKHKAYYRRKHAARQRGLKDIPGSHTDAEWEVLKVRYNYTCLCCGRSEPEIKLTRDHVIPITKGGTDYIDNIQPLCLSCNSSKNNKHVDYR